MTVVKGSRAVRPLFQRLLFLSLVAVAAFLVVPMPVSGAGGAEKKEEAEGEKPVKKKTTEELLKQPLPWNVPQGNEVGCSDEEILVLRDLRNRDRVLARRGYALDEREAALVELEGKVSSEMARLETLRAEILQLLTGQRSALKQRVKKLSRMVDQMKVKDAAELLSGIDEGVALQVLQTIKPKQAGKVLGAMPTAKSQKLADKLAELPKIDKSKLDGE
jgi:flagellar motility protein MotE (MotC chaperone)